MNQRYYSLDVFRGATVALMILVNNPGSWSHIFPPLDHAEWHGCTPTDLVFPFFLFAVGNAMAFVMPSLQKQGTPFFLKKVFKRSLLIFLIGLFLNWSPFLVYQNDHLIPKGWEWTNSSNTISGIRVMGVLQRIALCYLFAALIAYFFKPKTAALLSLAILLLYWIITAFCGSATSPYSLAGYFGTNIDIQLFGAVHVYKGEGVPFDPEGLSSTIAAIVEVVIGFFTGRFIQQKGKNFEMLSQLFVAGVLLVLAGYWWDMFFPINKKLWTSSYTIYTAGLAIITLAIFIYLIEFRQSTGKWSKFFNVFGKNPLFIFVLSGFLPRTLGLIRIVDHYATNGKPVYVTPFGWFYENICKNIVQNLSSWHIPPFNWMYKYQSIETSLRMGSLLYALVMIAFYWSIVYYMDKKKWYVKV